jgi:hypothetical protein
LRTPGDSDEVCWTTVDAGRTFLTIGRVNETRRPVGTLYRSNLTSPGRAMPRMRIGWAVSLVNDIVWTCPPELMKTVASRPSG